LKFGIALESFTPPGRTPDVGSILKCAVEAESLGFESIWLWDHLLLGSKRVYPVLESLTTLAYIGARTSTVKLATGVLILALRKPLVVAKMISTIQFLTGGRLIIGCAAGWYEREFRATGTDFHKRGRLFEETYLLVKKLISSQDVTYNSEDFVIEHATLEPRHSTPIPMLIGGYSDAALKRVGRISDGWVSYYYKPEDFLESWKKVESSAISSGRDPVELDRVDIVPLAISTSKDKGMNEALEFTRTYMDLPKNTACSCESSIVGDVKDCVDQIRKYEEAGVERLVFIPVKYDIDQIEKAGKEILPSFIKK
jgi:probable F420-dependent oxidoreductase